MITGLGVTVPPIFNDLRKFGIEYGFEVEEISKQDIEEVAVSSTKIRNALFDGQVEKANRFLKLSFCSCRNSGKR